jgi:hypothetical protein
MKYMLLPAMGFALVMAMSVEAKCNVRCGSQKAQVIEKHHDGPRRCPYRWRCHKSD